MRHCLPFIIRSGGACLCAAALLTGCGQTLRVRLERIGQVDGSNIGQRYVDPNPLLVAKIRAQMAALADRGLEVVESLGDPPPVRGSATATMLTEDAAYLRGLAAAMRDPSRRVTMEELQLEHARCQMTLEKYFAADLKPMLQNRERVNAQDLESSLKSILARGIEISTNEIAPAIEKGRIYGGYDSNTLFLLKPGSPALAELRSAKVKKNLRHELVYDPLRVRLSADSTLMVVQENPAYYTTRYLSSDPTQALHNTLGIVNRILRVAATFFPSIPVGAMPGSDPAQPAPPAAGGGPVAPPEVVSLPPAAVESMMAGMDDELRSRLKDPELVALLDKLRGGAGDETKLTPEELVRLREKVLSLQALVGTPGAGG